MTRAAIAIDDWKLPIFKRHLAQAGYAFEECPGLTDEMLLLKVQTDNLSALAVIVRAANTEAAGKGTKQ